MTETADEIGLPDDPDFRSTFVAYLEWGSRLAVANSRPGAEVMERAPVPQWGWGQTPHFVPQPWDDSNAAEIGRRNYAAKQMPATTEVESSERIADDSGSSEGLE